MIPVDSGTDDGVGCTLREAVEAANTDAPVGGCPAGSGTDDIRLDVALVTLTAGEIVIDSNVNIAPGSGRAGIEGAFDSRLFRVASGRTRFFRVDLVGGGHDGDGAADGGGIRAEGGSRVIFISGRIRGHSAPGSGGGVWVGALARFEAEDSVILRNLAFGDAATEGGGGIYSDGGTVTLTRTVVRGNRAVGAAGSGGGIHSRSAFVIIEGGVIVRNRAARAGGGVEIVGGTLGMTGVDFIENRAGNAPGNGGGVHAAGDAEVFGEVGSMDSNVATGEGGGLWIGADASATLTTWDVVNNRAQGAATEQGGGGVYVDGGALTLVDAGFVGNQATGAGGTGGGVFLNGGTASLDAACLFLENKAERAGGGIAVAAPTAAVLTLDGPRFEGNRALGAPANGAGVHSEGGDVTVTATGGTYVSNIARGSGGAFWLGAGTTAGLTNVVIDRNRALSSAAGAGGGGVFATSADLTVTGAVLSRNRAQGAGGALFQEFGTAAITTATLDANVAANGGAIAVQGGGAELTVAQSLASGNTAADRGGALFADVGPIVQIDNTTLYDNRADTGGGMWAGTGLYSTDSATIAENAASSTGGGIWADPVFDGFTLRNTIVADNGDGSPSPGEDPNLVGDFDSDGYNLIGTTPDLGTFTPAPTDLVGVDPDLEPLADNGGPTLTAALPAASPAVDAGDTALADDQRGFLRAGGGIDDIGAFERGATDPDASDATATPLAGLSTAVSSLGVFPNPMTTRATARLSVDATQTVTATLYDATGRRVREVFAGRVEAGEAIEVAVDASGLAAGVYVLVVDGETLRLTRTVSVVR